MSGRVLKASRKTARRPKASRKVKTSPAAAPQAQPNPLALTPEELARILTAAGGQTIAAAAIKADVEAGAPINGDGTINLVHYVAWLESTVDEES